MSDATSLTLVQVNDVHGYLEPHTELFWTPAGADYRVAGGYARIAGHVDALRRERPGAVLLLDGGDTLHGTRPAVDTEGAALVPVLNAIGFDAMTAHWEFGYGPAVLEERVAALDHPLLAANIYREGSDARPYPTHVVREVAGLRVGIVGVASHIVDKTMPPHFSAGLRFTTGNAELPGIIAALREEDRVDLVVVLSHLGFPQDMQLAGEVRGIDVILSAHTHNRLERPAVAGDTLVIQSGSHGAFLGQLELEIAGGRVVDYRHQLLPVTDAMPEHPEVRALVDEALAPYREALAEVVGETRTALNRGTSLEATMDNLLLQAMLHVTDAQVAFSNGWRYGAPVVPGPVTLNDLYNMVPMDPPVSTVELTGDEIRELLEENLERSYAHDAYEQMGGYVKRALGLRAFIRPENPRGNRIQHLFVGDAPVEAGRVYPTVFVTAQGVAPEYGQNRQKTGMTAIEALRRYLGAHEAVEAELRGTFTPI